MYELEFFEKAIARLACLEYSLYKRNPIYTLGNCSAVLFNSIDYYFKVNGRVFLNPHCGIVPLDVIKIINEGTFTKFDLKPIEN